MPARWLIDHTPFHVVRVSTLVSGRGSTSGWGPSVVVVAWAVTVVVTTSMVAAAHWATASTASTASSQLWAVTLNVAFLVTEEASTFTEFFGTTLT